MDFVLVVPATAAVAWEALWLQLVVIPFFNMREKLHKEYVDSGALDAALSFIESQRLIPSLAEMFDRAVADQTSWSKAPMADLLQSVDFLPSLAKAEAATREKKSLTDALDFLEACATRLWRWGLVHMILTAVVWCCFLLPNKAVHTAGERYSSTAFWIAICATGAAWGTSLVLMMWHLFQFDRRRNLFLASLRANRQIK